MMTLVADVIKSKKQTSVSSLDIKMLIEETTNKSSVKKTRSVSETSEPEMVSSKKRSPRLSETSLDCSEAEAGLEAGVARLLEMFPTCCKVEAIHCLTIMGGDLERAAQMVLTRSAVNGEAVYPIGTHMSHVHDRVNPSLSLRATLLAYL